MRKLMHMKARTTVTRESVDRIKEMLLAAPPSDRMHLLEAVRVLTPAIQEMRKKGYSMTDVAEVLKQQGMDLSVRSLRNGMRQSAVKADRRRRNPRSASIPQGDSGGDPRGGSIAEGGERSGDNDSAAQRSVSKPRTGEASDRPRATGRTARASRGDLSPSAHADSSPEPSVSGPQEDTAVGSSAAAPGTASDPCLPFGASDSRPPATGERGSEATGGGEVDSPAPHLSGPVQGSIIGMATARAGALAESQAGPGLDPSMTRGRQTAGSATTSLRTAEAAPRDGDLLERRRTGGSDVTSSGDSVTAPQGDDTAAHGRPGGNSVASRRPDRIPQNGDAAADGRQDGGSTRTSSGDTNAAPQNGSAADCPRQGGGNPTAVPGPPTGDAQTIEDCRNGTATAVTAHLKAPLRRPHALGEEAASEAVDRIGYPEAASGRQPLWPRETNWGAQAARSANAEERGRCSPRGTFVPREDSEEL